MDSEKKRQLCEIVREFLNSVPGHVDEFDFTGSAFIEGVKNPGDLDCIVLVNDTTEFEDVLTGVGYVMSDPGDYNAPEPGRDPSEGVFFSFRKGEINLIVTDNRRFYDSFRVASEICRMLKVTEKENRVDVHGLLRQEWPKLG